MKKRKPSFLLILGVALISISIIMILVVQIAMDMGAKHSREIASQIGEMLPERTVGMPGTYPAADMPALEIDGRDYVALIEIPSLGVKLPVADGWNSYKLFLSPTRFLGSAYDSTLIIGGVDDDRQFGFCDEVAYGTVIVVTDMTGTEFTYEVTGIGRADHAEPLWLADEDTDLTLFCRSRSSMEYIAVRCSLTCK